MVWQGASVPPLTEAPLWIWLNFSPCWQRFLELRMPQSRILGLSALLNCYSTLDCQCPAFQSSVGSRSWALE